MKYSFLLLVVCVSFSRCAEWEKGKEPPAKSFSLAGLYADVKKIDSSSAILKFQPDTGVFRWNRIFINEFYPDLMTGLKGNEEHIVETEFSQGDRGEMTQDFTKEYFFENGRPVKITDNNPDNPYTQTLTYDAAGRMIENKMVFEEEGDSTAMEYQYDAQQRLTKILHFDVLNKLVHTTHIYYHPNGNLDSVFHEDTEGEDYTYKYFSNSESKRMLKVRLEGKQHINVAIFYVLNDAGDADMEEQYLSGLGSMLRKNKYAYNESGELTKTETVGAMGFNMEIRQSYTKRDAAGNWTEMLSYRDGDLFSTTRRTITYKQPAP